MKANWALEKVNWAVVTKARNHNACPEFHRVPTAVSNDLIFVLSFNPVSMLLSLNGMILSMEKVKIGTYQSK